MANYVIYLFLHFIVCLLFFLGVQRPVFFAYNKRTSEKQVSASDLIAASRRGLKSDVTGAAYMTALPLLVLWACAYIRPHHLMLPLLIAEGIVAFVAALITLGDLVLYGHWRFRIDVSVFPYLKSLKSAFASVTLGYVALALVALLLIAGALFGAFYALAVLTGVFDVVTDPCTLLSVLGKTGVMLVCAVVTFACIRGVDHRPKSPYDLYYSNNMYLNHTTVNPLFSLAYSSSLKSKESESFKVFDAEECRTEVENVLPTSGVPMVQLLNTQRPNILVIVWESLSAYFTKHLGDKEGITENFDRLADEGILFTRVDAGSWRTDPALACIFSGYPGQPTTIITRDTHKLPGLPALPRQLKKAGYKTSVVHGGQLSYMHIIDYCIVAGHDRVVDVNDMPADAPRCAWGVHDGYMYDWLYEDIIKRDVNDQPWFTTFLTLSSHQPYTVPYKKLDDEIENAYAYADDAFGRFIDRLKKTDAWHNTLIVVMGDHGINISFMPMPRIKQPHIPLLLLGGAIKAPMKIDTIMNQTDFAATLLGQLDMPHDMFIFSRDVLADTYKYPFSINIYNNGFVYRDSTGATEYDNVAKRAVDGDDPERVRRGLMFMQYMMEDVGKR